MTIRRPVFGAIAASGWTRTMRVIRLRHCVAMMAFAVALGSPHAIEAATAPDVRFDHSGLTVRIDHVPLDEVLAAVARETGITIEGEPLDNREVTKRFEAVPLAQGLKRLIGRQNFTLRYGANGEPVSLELLGAPLPPQTSPRRRGLTAIQLLIRHPPVAVPAHTAQVLGRRVVSLQRVLGGLRHADPIVRAECGQTLIRALEDSHDTLAAFRRLDVKQLTRLVASHAGSHASEVATTLYQSARDPVFKSRLSLVVGSLRARSS